MHDEAPDFLQLLEGGDTEAIMVQPQMRPRQPRGDWAKIVAAVTALRGAGQLPEYLNLSDISRRCNVWLKSQGLLAHEIPSRSTYYRYLADVLDALRA